MVYHKRLMKYGRSARSALKRLTHHAYILSKEMKKSNGAMAKSAEVLEIFCESQYVARSLYFRSNDVKKKMSEERPASAALENATTMWPHAAMSEKSQMDQRRHKAYICRNSVCNRRNDLLTMALPLCYKPLPLTSQLAVSSNTWRNGS